MPPNRKERGGEFFIHINDKKKHTVFWNNLAYHCIDFLIFDGGLAKCQDPPCTGKKQNEKLTRCTVCYFVYHWRCVQGRDALAMRNLVARVLADNRAPSKGGQAKCQDPSCTGKKQNEKLARCTVCYFVYHWWCAQGRDALAMRNLVARVLADNRAPSKGGQAKCQDPSCTGMKQNEKSARCTV